MDAHQEFKRGISAIGNSREGWTKTDWGMIKPLKTELEALRLAYAHKDHPHGFQIRATQSGSYRFTLFNEEGGKMFNGRK